MKFKIAIANVFWNIGTFFSKLSQYFSDTGSNLHKKFKTPQGIVLEQSEKVFKDIFKTFTETLEKNTTSTTTEDKNGKSFIS